MGCRAGSGRRRRTAESTLARPGGQGHRSGSRAGAMDEQARATAATWNDEAATEVDAPDVAPRPVVSTRSPASRPTAGSPATVGHSPFVPPVGRRTPIEVRPSRSWWIRASAGMPGERTGLPTGGWQWGIRRTAARARPRRRSAWRGSDLRRDALSRPVDHRRSPRGAVTVTPARLRGTGHGAARPVFMEPERDNRPGVRCKPSGNN